MHAGHIQRPTPTLAACACTRVRMNGAGVLYLGTGVLMSGDVVTKAAYADAHAAHTAPLDASDRTTIHMLVAKLKEHLRTRTGPTPRPDGAVGGDGPDASNGGDGNAANESHLGTIISACKVATILAEDGHITRAALADLTSCSASARFTRLRPRPAYGREGRYRRRATRHRHMHRLLMSMGARPRQ